MAKPIEMVTGDRYENWIVLGPDPIAKRRSRDAIRYLCLCTGCNVIYSVRGSDLRTGGSTKCKRCATKINLSRPRRPEPDERQRLKDLTMFHTRRCNCPGCQRLKALEKEQA